MRILLFFDLPTNTPAEKREYIRFRKMLLKNGFYMMQESVYCKLTLNTTITDAVITNIRKNKPASGLVQVLTITEKQFSKIDNIIGATNSLVLDSDERLIVL